MIKLRKRELVLDKTVRRLCREPYEGHPKGCPNWDKKPGCPPQAPLLGQLLDLDQPVYLVYNCFDLADHVATLKQAHPAWSRRQLTCCLYWQGTARKQLRTLITLALVQLNDDSLEVVNCPEACGVNVTATMHGLGITLEWPPTRFTYQVALIGTRKEG